MTGKKKKTTSAADKEIKRLEEELQTVRKNKTAAAKKHDGPAIKRLQAKETELRTRLLEVKSNALSAVLSPPKPVEDRSKALLEVLEERLEIIEHRLSAIEDKLEKL